MQKKTIYLPHKELCEMFDVPEDSVLVADGDSLLYRPDAQMWMLTVKVGTKEELEAMAEDEF